MNDDELVYVFFPCFLFEIVERRNYHLVAPPMSPSDCAAHAHEPTIMPIVD